jgi:hypothetical protein
VGHYIKLRDWVKEQEDALKKKLALAKLEMAKIEGEISEFLRQTKQNSGTADTGTFYLSEKNSASISDKAEFRRFVFSLGDPDWWDLVDLRANANVVEEFAKSHDGTLPPGVNFQKVETIHVNRSRAKG